MRNAALRRRLFKLMVSQLSNARSFIDQIRLSQVQDPPGTALVQVDDATHLVNSGPVCVDSAPTTVNPELGAVRLDL